MAFAAAVERHSIWRAWETVNCELVSTEYSTGHLQYVIANFERVGTDRAVWTVEFRPEVVARAPRMKELEKLVLQSEKLIIKVPSYESGRHPDFLAWRFVAGVLRGEAGGKKDGSRSE